MLKVNEPAALLVKDVPNARISSDLVTLEMVNDEKISGAVRDLRKSVDEHDTRAVDPESFWRLGQKTDYSVEVSWASNDRDGRYDVCSPDSPA